MPCVARNYLSGITGASPSQVDRFSDREGRLIRAATIVARFEGSFLTEPT